MLHLTRMSEIHSKFKFYCFSQGFLNRNKKNNKKVIKSHTKGVQNTQNPNWDLFKGSTPLYLDRAMSLNQLRYT